MAWFHQVGDVQRILASPHTQVNKKWVAPFFPELLIGRVEYDSNEGTLEVEYHPTAIAALIEHAEEVA